jgi:hypothetical protein
MLEREEKAKQLHETTLLNEAAQARAMAGDRRLRARALLGGLVDDIKENRCMGDLDIGGIQLDATAISVLCEALCENTTCMRLDLSYRNLCDEDISPVEIMLACNHSIQSLHMDRNRLGPGSLRTISGCIKPDSSLRVLSLSLNDLTCHGTHVEPFLSFCDSLSANTTLRSLDLSYCGISHSCLTALLRALRHNLQITWISVVGNEVNDALWSEFISICSRNLERFNEDRSRHSLEIASMTGEDESSNKLSVHYRQTEGDRAEIEDLRGRLWNERVAEATERFNEQRARRIKLGAELWAAALERLPKPASSTKPARKRP